MKKYLVILVLLFATNAWSAPSSSLSIAPVAVDAAVIEASDENTRNSAVTTWANAHDHTDISTVGNTLSVGDGTAGNKTIQANNADGTKPFIRFDDTNDRWVSSRDGTNIESIMVVTGVTGGKFVFPESPTDGDILIYGSATDTWVSTAQDVEASFLVEAPGTQTGIVAGSAVTITFTNENFDITDNFATNTFTSPISGRYILTWMVRLGDIDTEATTYTIQLVTSNLTVEFIFDPAAFVADVDFSFAYQAVMDMDASDTAIVQINQAGGTNQTDIDSGNFTGALIQ